MRTVVADASAIVEYLLRTEAAEAIDPIVTDSDTDVHVPALCDVEVAAAIRRALLQRRITVERAEEAVADYLDLPLIRHGHERLMAPILRRRANFSAYDATYVTLAETLSALLLSADHGLLRATRRHTRIRSAIGGPGRSRPTSLGTGHSGRGDLSERSEELLDGEE
ncbi:MAG TPA: type II toxin-antitoxin system VapC family toxin [Gemmatimonadota bacterium]|nr:type II toxin-antitoxin system VapC family toxin [Gemmatimonadota bacterium]